MKINIKELQNLPEKKVSITFQEKLNELETDNTVKAELDIEHKNYGINVSGNVKADIKLVCDLCLEEYDYHIDVDVNEDIVFDSIVPPDQKEYELTKGQFVEELNNREEIDITDFVYQTVILEIPTQKICNDTCEGSEAYQKIKNEKYIDERLEVFKSFSENNFRDEEENNK